MRQISSEVEHFTVKLQKNTYPVSKNSRHVHFYYNSQTIDSIAKRVDSERFEEML